MAHALNTITLGVRDVARARAFYEALGWQGSVGEEGDPVFFSGRGLVVALWDRALLAKDSCVSDGGGWGGVTFAVCLPSRADVDTVTDTARTAGGTVAREPADTFWGGYDAIVLDPDGHPWEFAHNPFWTLTEDGGVTAN